MAGSEYGCDVWWFKPREEVGGVYKFPPERGVSSDDQSFLSGCAWVRRGGEGEGEGEGKENG